MTDKQAIDIINLYGEDILNSEGMNLEKQFPHHGDVTTFDHSLSVAVLCLKIANKLSLQVDTVSLIRGALLHDYYLYDWHIPDKSHILHGFRHPKRALQNAKRDFCLSSTEQNMILSHMFPLTPTLPKQKESIMLCVADKICATKEIVSNFIFRK